MIEEVVVLVIKVLYPVVAVDTGKAAHHSHLGVREYRVQRTYIVALPDNLLYRQLIHLVVVLVLQSCSHISQPQLIVHSECCRFKCLTGCVERFVFDHLLRVKPQQHDNDARDYQYETRHPERQLDG